MTEALERGGTTANDRLFMGQLRAQGSQALLGELIHAWIATGAQCP